MSDQNYLEIVVVGAHLSGMPLNHQLTDAGGVFVRSARTAPDYRLYALPGSVPPKPGLIREPGFTGAGATPGVEVEVWSLPPAAFGAFVAAIPAPASPPTPSHIASEPPVPAPMLTPPLPPVEVTIRMPDLQKMEPAGAAKLSKWMKQIGDLVAAHDVICEIETENCTLGYTAQAGEEGIVTQILVPAGSTNVHWRHVRVFEFPSSSVVSGYWTWCLVFVPDVSGVCSSVLLC